MTIKLLTTYRNLNVGDVVITKIGDLEILEIEELSATHFRIRTNQGWHFPRLKLNAYQKVDRKKWQSN
jgi:hypothetical protein